MLSLIHIYESHHKVLIRAEALEAAVSMSERYITDRNLPDKRSILNFIFRQNIFKINIDSRKAPPSYFSSQLFQKPFLYLDIFRKHFYKLIIKSSFRKDVYKRQARTGVPFSTFTAALSSG